MSKSKLFDKIGQFTTIPNSVIAMWPTIGLDAMALFLYLRYRTNAQTGDAFPSFDTIRVDTGLTRRRIAIAARKLEKAGLLERKRRFSASTIYTLKMPDSISNDAGLIETPISNDAGLPLVQGMHTNQIDLNKNELDHSKFKTVDIKAAFSSCVTYPINWAAGSGASAKWLAENGYTPDDVIGCYKAMSSDPWWKDKEISLKNVANKIGAWKQRATSRKVINVRA